MLIGQVGENGEINSVLGEDLSVLGHAEFLSQSAICCIGRPHLIGAHNEAIE